MRSSSSFWSLAEKYTEKAQVPPMSTNDKTLPAALESTDAAFAATGADFAAAAASTGPEERKKSEAATNKSAPATRVATFDWPTARTGSARTWTGRRSNASARCRLPREAAGGAGLHIAADKQRAYGWTAGRAKAAG